MISLTRGTLESSRDAADALVQFPPVSRGRRGCGAASGASLSETASGADLGGNSKYSDENF